MARSPTATDALIHARGLTKRFAKLVAVDAIDFDVERGEAFGFLGPNGAGKTSTMRMIGCVSRASGGSLRVLGLDPVEDGPRIRARLGVVPQSDTLDTELLVDENLFTYARYFGIARNEARRRAEQLLDFVQLRDRAVVMDKAKIVAFGSPRSLIDKYSSREVLELRFPIDATPALDKLNGLAQRIEVLPDRVLLYTNDGEAAAVAVHSRGLRPEAI